MMQEIRLRPTGRGQVPPVPRRGREEAGRRSQDADNDPGDPEAHWRTVGQDNGPGTLRQERDSGAE